MRYRLALPDLGEGIAEGEVLIWLARPGETIAADQPLVEVATDKADVVIPSPVDGVVASLCVEPGRSVAVGTVLAEIESDRVPDDVVLDGRDGVPASAPPAPADGREDEVDVRALPAVRRLARELGVDLAAVRPSGPDGRVTAADLRGAAEVGKEGPLRRTISRRLSAAASVPTVINVDEADFEAVLAAGRSPLVAVARAVTLALRDYPRLNAWRLDDGMVTEHRAVHLGIATETPKGLVVPVVRDAHLLTVDPLGAAIAAQTNAACQGRAGPGDLCGSTVTITSAGRCSGLFATPLLNLPEIAIVGLYRIAERAVVRDGAVVARRIGHLSVTFDHRAVDGALAGAFLARLVEILEGWPADHADPEAAD